MPSVYSYLGFAVVYFAFACAPYGGFFRDFVVTFQKSMEVFSVK